ASLGKQVSFVGSSTRTTNVSCPAAAGVTSATQGGGPSRVDIDRVEAVKQAHESDLMADPAVMAVGIGADERNSAVITVYVETGRMHGAIPAGKENRLTGAKVIGGLDTALQTSLEFTTSRNCSVELKKIPDNSVEWGRKHRLFD